MFNTIKYAALIGALVLVPAVSANAAMTAEQCAALFKTADTNADGSLGGDEAKRFEEAMTKATIKTKDAGIVTMEEFNAACEKGTFDGM